MAEAQDPFASFKEYGREHGYDLRWLQRSDVWDQPAELNAKKGGLLLQDIDRGVAAEVPEESRNLTGRPRGRSCETAYPALATIRCGRRQTSGCATGPTSTKRR